LNDTTHPAGEERKLWAVGIPENVETSASPDHGTAVERLFRSRQLTPAQRRIANFLATQRPADAAYLTVNEVAAGAGVSQPSVSRFALALGFAGFNQLREAIRRVAREATAQPGGDRSEMNAAQELISSEIESLRRLQTSINDPAGLATAAATLSGSRPLPVVGLRISAPLADLFGQFAAKVLPDVRVLTQAGSPLIESIERAKRDGASCMLAFGLPRYPRQLHEAITWARTLELKVVLISDTRFSSIAEAADQVLVAEVSHQSTFDSYAAPTVLCTLLLQQVLDSLSPEQLANLDHFDELAQKQCFFVP
jgi:DNA-binding MurR/RpiR family transcriptional regulator